MTPKLKVAYVSTELAPYAKSGELADVGSSLPKYLAALGLEVAVFLPKYRLPEVESLPVELVLPKLMVPLGERKVKAQVFRTELGGYPLYLIDSPTYFWRDSIYGTGKGEYLDNDERFVFFNRAVLEFLWKAKKHMDVIHCNSWHTALIPVFLKTHYADKAFFKKTASLFTLHNVTYQGEFPPESLALTGLNWSYLSPEQLSLNGQFNFLKAGIQYADMITTVSEAYKREIQTEKYGLGLENILKRRRKDFESIRNGVDYEVWDPETDPFITANYASGNLGPKKECKKDLIGEFGLTITAETLLLGVFSYLTSHKGIDILLEALDDLMAMDLGLVVLGVGEEKFEIRLREAQERYPGRLAVRLDMNPALAHKLMAGTDVFLMPSRSEPCGLGQLYAFRYATVPVVRATGGLAETVKPFRRRSMTGNGFVFQAFTSAAMLRAIQQALKYYRTPEVWAGLMEAGLRENFSWDKAARRYARLYQKALIKRRSAWAKTS